MDSAPYDDVFENDDLVSIIVKHSWKYKFEAFKKHGPYLNRTNMRELLHYHIRDLCLVLPSVNARFMRIAAEATEAFWKSIQADLKRHDAVAQMFLEVWKPDSYVLTPEEQEQMKAIENPKVPSYEPSDQIRGWDWDYGKKTLDPLFFERLIVAVLLDRAEGHDFTHVVCSKTRFEQHLRIRRPQSLKEMHLQLHRKSIVHLDTNRLSKPLGAWFEHPYEGIRKWSHFYPTTIFTNKYTTLGTWLPYTDEERMVDVTFHRTERETPTYWFVLQADYTRSLRPVEEFFTDFMTGMSVFDNRLVSGHIKRLFRIRENAIKKLLGDDYERDKPPITDKIYCRVPITPFKVDMLDSNGKCLRDTCIISMFGCDFAMANRFVENGRFLRSTKQRFANMKHRRLAQRLD